MEKDSIRKFRNTVQLNFVARGDNFTLKVPHYNKWRAIIRFLIKRGWTIDENPDYVKHYSCLSKYNKLGFKNNMACLLEIGPAFISIQFGNIKNLWTVIRQSFWDDPSDDRFTQLTYLESCAVKLEIWKLIKFCEKWNFEFTKEKDQLSPEEYIIDNLRINDHIHGKVTCLNDIKIDIKDDSYDATHNSTDKNGKRIICGETKYYYDYRTRRLSCGVVWHHINNMWWVIGGGKLRNIASFNLFDFDKSLPRRKPISNEGIEKLLSRFERIKDYNRCLQIAAFYQLKAS